MAKYTYLPTYLPTYATRYIFVYKMAPPRWSVKTRKRGSGTSIINYTYRRDDKETKKKSKSRLTSYIVFLNVQGFAETNGFPRSLFIFKSSFVFVFSCFCGWEDFFLLEITKCWWNFGNTGETSVTPGKWSYNFHADESLEMRVSSHIC